MKTIAIIQARTGSTRLPAKVLRDLCGKPMLLHEIERIGKASNIDSIVVATTTSPSDDAIALHATAAGVHVFRGDETDVLDRFYQAAKMFGATTVVRLTGDCPLHDPEVLDEVIAHFFSATTPLDYTSTPRNYPEGLDAEVFSFASLETAWKNARLPSEHEHVTPYLKNHPEQFVRDTWMSGTRDDSHMHWSVDTEADFTFVESIYKALYATNPEFGKDQVLALLDEHPELLNINAGATGYEGLAKSLVEDKQFLEHQS